MAKVLSYEGTTCDNCACDSCNPDPNFDYKGKWQGNIKDVGFEGSLIFEITYQVEDEFGGSVEIQKGEESILGIIEAIARFNTEEPDAFRANLVLSGFPNCDINLQGARQSNSIKGTFKPYYSGSDDCNKVPINLGTFEVFINGF